MQKERTLEYLSQHIESLIFAAEQPITLEEMGSSLEEVFGMAFSPEDLTDAIENLKARYRGDDFAFEVVEIAGGFQFFTKPSYHRTVGAYLKQTMKKRLSQAALETLSIIAYKQPVSKSELERIRGVSCDYAMQKLLEKELITITGRSEGPGKPLLYGTSPKFMDYFGLRSIEDLPRPKEFKDPDENSIGEQAPIEEEVS